VGRDDCQEAFGECWQQHTARQTLVLDQADMLAQYKTAKKRLLMFDYDGTLTPIVKVSSRAIPTARTHAAISALAATQRTSSTSFLDGDFLEEHWGMVPNLGLSAGHGSLSGGQTRASGTT
jgi:trehalose 6-phosphate synthase/phosphatase